MEKLIIERDESDFYKLEVNDNGDYIEFDLTDIGLPERMIEATSKIPEIDERYTNGVNEVITDENLTDVEKAIKITEIENKFFEEMNKTYDAFLGEGACKKIFGGKKSHSQYIKMLDALEPHFEKMHIKQQKAKRKLADRYLNKDSDTL